MNLKSLEILSRMRVLFHCTIGNMKATRCSLSFPKACRCIELQRNAAEVKLQVMPLVHLPLRMMHTGLYYSLFCERFKDN